MRHRKANVKLGRTAAHRRALLRNLATFAFENGAITTTVAKAKAVKPVIDRLVTLAKRGDLHAIRQASAILTKPKVLKELFDEAKEKFRDRTCGYSSVVKLRLRAGDAAPLARLTLIGPDYVKVVSAKAPRKVADRGRRVAASQEAKAAPKTKEAAPTLDKAPNTAPDTAPDTAPNQTPDQTPPEADKSASE